MNTDCVVRVRDVKCATGAVIRQLVGSDNRRFYACVMGKSLGDHYRPLFEPLLESGEVVLDAGNANCDEFYMDHGRPSIEGAVAITNRQFMYAAYSGVVRIGFPRSDISNFSKERVPLPGSVYLVMNLKDGTDFRFLFSKENYKYLKRHF